jgi:hypothetical protein
MGAAERGAAGGKQVKGRTRPLVVETLGVLMVVLITRAGGGMMESRQRHYSSGSIRKIAPVSKQSLTITSLTSMPFTLG